MSANKEAIDQYLNDNVKEVLEYLWEFSLKNNWEFPSIFPYDSDLIIGACVQWGWKIIIYVLLELTYGKMTIEVDYNGDIRDFDYPTKLSQLEMFLLK